MMEEITTISDEDEINPYKEAVRNLLLDNKYMYVQALAKVEELINGVENGALEDAGKELKVLFERVLLNVVKFQEQLEETDKIQINNNSQLNNETKPNETPLEDKASAEKAPSVKSDDLGDDLATSSISVASLDQIEPKSVSFSQISGSFDFDESNQLQCTPTINQEQFQKNTELLLLLKKVTGVDEAYSDDGEQQKYEESDVDDKPEDGTVSLDVKAEEALNLLEDTDYGLSENDEFSSLSDSDSIGRVKENESNDLQFDDTKLDSASSFVDLPKIERLSESQIDEICSLNDIDQNRVESEIAKLRLGRKRRRKISSCTSSEDSSSSNTDNESIDFNSSELRYLSSPEVEDSKSDDDVNWADLLCDIDQSSDSDSFESDSTCSNVTVVEIGKANKKETCKNDSELSDSEEPPPKKLKRRSRFELSTTDSESDDVKPTICDLLTDSDDEVHVIEYLDDSDVEFISNEAFASPSKGRKNIREIISDNELTHETQLAKEEENERIQRLDQLTKLREGVLSQTEYDLVLDVDVKTSKPLIIVDSNISKKLKTHQRTGVQFMWDICYESIEMLKTSKGTGCILAHSMGLGKTLQVIALVHTLFNYAYQTQTKTVLIVCPLSTVLNWKREFDEAFQLAEKKPQIVLYVLVKEEIAKRVQMLREWRLEGGVLIMGYESFEILSSREREKSRLCDLDKKELEIALVRPGPDLIVCDEGHILKNSDTKRTKALMKVKTLRRIVLTGTPLQNNLTEYYFMVQFVKPNLLGTPNEYKNRFVNPIMNGQYYDSTNEDITLMKKRTHVLNKVLKKTIDRVDMKVLKQYLPELTDFALFVRLSPLQEQFYSKYINYAREKCSGASLFTDLYLSRLMTLHPWLYNQYLERKQKKTKEKVIRDAVLKNWSMENLNPITPDDISYNMNYGSKLSVIIGIIDEAYQTDDKLLIFASTLCELDCIEYFLKTVGTNLCNSWKLNVNYYRMDGHIGTEERHTLCSKFNKPDNKIKLFLITSKVGSLGLNLTAANRVILIGSNFNPSCDTQAIFRVYRFGQTKKCYIYRILSAGTLEEKIYRKCIVKLALAGTVVDKKHIARHFKPGELAEYYTYDSSEYADERPLPSVPHDTLLAKLLHSNKSIHTYHEHEALLKNRPEEELNDEEKQLAWDEFERIEQAEPINETIAIAGPSSGNYSTQIPIIQNLQRIMQYRMRTPNVTVRPPTIDPLSAHAQIRPNRPAGPFFQLGRDSTSLVRVLANPPRFIPPELRQTNEFNYNLNKII